MAYGNFARRRGTGLRRDWRGSAHEPSSGRRGRQGAEHHTVALIAAGLITATAAAAVIPRVKLPTLPERNRVSLSRTLYPRLPSVPDPSSPSAPVLPRETPVSPSAVGPSETVTIRELDPVADSGATRSGVENELEPVTRGAVAPTSGSRKAESAAPRKPEVAERSSGARSRSAQPRKSTRTRKVRVAQANSVRRAPGRSAGPTRKRRVVRKSAPVTVARHETRTSGTRAERSARGTTTTAGWVGSTDSREEAFLREWRRFKTREERIQEVQRKRLSEQLVVEPLE